MTADDLFKILKEYSKKISRFPEAKEFAEHSNLPVEVIEKVYKRWINQGKLVRKDGKVDFYRDPNKLFEDEGKYKPDNMEIVSSTNRKIPEPELPKKEPSAERNLLGTFVRIIVGVIGVLLILNSIHFTFNFNRMSMKLFWGISLSVSIVAFMSIAFTLMSYMEKRMMKVFVFVLWVLGFVYSVFTAVSGQYNDFRKYLSTDKSRVIESQKEIVQTQLDAQVKKQEELLHWREQEAEYSLNPNLKTENPGTWKKIQDGIEKLEECEVKIEELQEKMMEIVSVDVVSDETVYSWLSRTLNVSPDVLHLAVILFPSIFIDLCSGLCLMFALSERKGKKNPLRRTYQGNKRGFHRK